MKKTRNHASKWHCTLFSELMQRQKRQFVAMLRPPPRSDLPTFYEKNKKSCFEMTLYVFFSTYAVPKAVVRCYIKNSPQKWPADILWKIHEIMLRNEIVRFFSLMKCRKRQFIAVLRNSLRSDLPTFCEKLMKLCFEMKLYVFLITYAVPKATVHCCVKKLPQKWPADILWEPHEIMLRNEIVRFFDHLYIAENDSSLLH